MSLDRILHTLACLGGLLLVDATVSASERPALTGYAQIRFGMPEGELRTKVRIGEPRDYDKGGVWWTGMSPVNFAGPPSFALKILIQDGVVARISLLRIGRVDNPSCKARFDWLVENVAKQYGAPDTNRKPAIKGLDDSYEAIFRFEDGAFIEVQSMLNVKGTACADSIGFFQTSPD
jgi:hypothetical protein